MNNDAHTKCQEVAQWKEQIAILILETPTWPALLFLLNLRYAHAHKGRLTRDLHANAMFLSETQATFRILEGSQALGRKCHFHADWRRAPGSGGTGRLWRSKLRRMFRGGTEHAEPAEGTYHRVQERARGKRVVRRPNNRPRRT